MKIINGTVFSNDFHFHKRNLYTEGASITASSVSDMVYDASNCYVIPGLVDIHFHGAMGHDFCDGTKEAFDAIASFEVSHGVTSICPATMTLSSERLISICKAAKTFSENTSEMKSSFVGIHLEGPFLSYEKRGAQNPEYLRNPSIEEIHTLMNCSGGLIKLLSIAPELPGSMEAISALKSQMVLSLAHTTADYQTACEAFEMGASHVTHLYNAMMPFSHRAPGVIGAAFDHHADVELICDGIHVDPCVVRSTFQLFSKEHVILISDSMEACGMPDGNYALGGQAVSVKGPLATLSDGTIAGSASTLFSCMKNAISMGISPEIAIQAATYNPAKSIGIENHVGTLEPSMDADLLILNQDFSLCDVIHHGVLLPRI